VHPKRDAPGFIRGRMSQLDDIPQEPLVLNEKQSAALARLEGEPATLWVRLCGEGLANPGFSLEGYADEDGAVVLYIPGPGEEI